MRRNITRAISSFAIFIAAILFVAIFGGPNILKGYIKAGIGGCDKIPILCKSPVQEITIPKIEREFADTLIPYKFSRLSLSAPKGFSVIQELEKKPYYKKRMSSHKESFIYTFRQGPGYFIKLFPQVKNAGVSDNYAFIKRLNSSDINKVKNIIDAFFVILKSIFTPDIGDQNKVVMAYFSGGGKRGFISYNLFDKEYYFDCNLVDDNGDFFKVYIKDAEGALGLKEVLAIISTLRRQE